MGIPVDILNWFEEDDRCFDYAPVDDETRETLTEMIKIRNIALKSEDYEALKQLKQDLKVVFELGKEMWHIKREINFCVAKEDYTRAIDLRSRLKKMEAKRDGYDALYETSRYERMVTLLRPNTADYLRSLELLDEEERRKADVLRR